MDRIPGVTLSLLRIAAAVLYLSHGGQKLFGWFGGLPGMPPGHLPPLLLAAGIIETVGGVLLLVGLFTRPVAFVTSGEMAVGYFIAHFPHGFWPILNKGEMAVILCFTFLCLWGNGPGPISLDALLARGRVRARARSAGPDVA